MPKPACPYVRRAAELILMHPHWKKGKATKLALEMANYPVRCDVVDLLLFVTCFLVGGVKKLFTLYQEAIAKHSANKKNDKNQTDTAFDGNDHIFI